MRLTTSSEYSPLALIYIVRHGIRRLVNVGEICSHYRISKEYPKQLRWTLGRGGYVRTSRWAGGGYRLATLASRIRVGDVIRLTDGALATTVSAGVYFHVLTPLSWGKTLRAFFRRSATKCRRN